MEQDFQLRLKTVLESEPCVWEPETGVDRGNGGKIPTVFGLTPTFEIIDLSNFLRREPFAQGDVLGGVKKEVM
ncbi:hypothetical protein CEXT_488331 [Caerostris extrusa]|uniref:Uncharacterized protein n=1 Tax=Caerostris extrusa TaxID=172846 RepID=A0AAV4XCA7_CAEEX|nr:hypothetical protein CEXT_488331 [Caerostris extrusa]